MNSTVERDGNLERELRRFVLDNFLFGQAADSFSDEDSFLDKGLIDSIGVLTLVDFVREKYAIEIKDEELVPENWDSVRRVASFVKAKLNGAAKPVTLISEGSVRQ